LPERCSIGVPAVINNINRSAVPAQKIFAVTVLRRVPVPLHPCWRVWNLWHSIKFSAHFLDFCGGFCPRPHPGHCPCMDPWWRNPLSPPKQIPGYAPICYGKTKQLAKSLTRF